MKNNNDKENFPECWEEKEGRDPEMFFTTNNNNLNTVLMIADAIF